MSTANPQQVNLADKDKDEALRHREFILDWFDRAIKQRENQKDQSRKGELQWGTSEQLNLATWVLGIFQITLIILFATVGGSQILPEDAQGTVTQGYNMFIGVEIMM